MTEGVEREFGEVAAIAVQWMQEHGFPDATLMPDAGAGIFDIDSDAAIAEVTVNAPPARPDVQRLDGVTRAENKPALYFSARGFTTSAEEWAINVGIALFSLDKDSDEIVPVNKIATDLANRPRNQDQRMLQAANRALSAAREEALKFQAKKDSEVDTMKRVEAAKEAKAMRRQLLDD